MNSMTKEGMPHPHDNSAEQEPPLSDSQLEKRLAAAAARSKFIVDPRPHQKAPRQEASLETYAAGFEQLLGALTDRYGDLPKELRQLSVHEPITLDFLAAIDVDAQTLADCRRLADDTHYGWPSATAAQVDYIRSPYANRDDFWRHLTQAPDRDMVDDPDMTKDPNNLWGRLRTLPIDQAAIAAGYSPTLEERVYNTAPYLKRADTLCGDFMAEIRQLFTAISQSGSGNMPGLLATIEHNHAELPIRDAIYFAYNLLRQLSMPDDPMKQQQIAHDAYGLPIGTPQSTTAHRALTK